MMKQKQITLTQNDAGCYVVESLVNRTEPKLGVVLNEAEVKSYIQQRDTKVTIKRARS